MLRAACDGHYGNENWEFNADVEAPTNCHYQRSDDLCKRAQVPPPGPPLQTIPSLSDTNVARVRYWHEADVQTGADECQL